MTQQEAISRLSRYQSQSQSSWRDEETSRRIAKQQGWQQYSRRIAIKAALSMTNQNISRQELAKRLNRSEQYVAQILKGEIDLSLNEICDIESALNIHILQYGFA